MVSNPPPVPTNNRPNSRKSPNMQSNIRCIFARATFLLCAGAHRRKNEIGRVRDADGDTAGSIPNSFGGNYRSCVPRAPGMKAGFRGCPAKLPFVSQEQDGARPIIAIRDFQSGMTQVAQTNAVGFLWGRLLTGGGFVTHPQGRLIIGRRLITCRHGPAAHKSVMKTRLGAFVCFLALPWRFRPCPTKLLSFVS